MIQAIEAYLITVLGSPSAVGSSSWLEVIAWVSALLAAIAAVISLRRQSFQSRATFLLHLNERWEALSDARRYFYGLFQQTRAETLAQHAGLQNVHQVEHLRAALAAKMKTLRDKDTEAFGKLIRLASFFEFVGMYVKNGYMPIRDVIQLYKGPILDVDMAFRDFAEHWQKEAHVPEGLLEHMLYLTRRVRRREESPRIFRWLL